MNIWNNAKFEDGVHLCELCQNDLLFLASMGLRGEISPDIFKFYLDIFISKYKLDAIAYIYI